MTSTTSTTEPRFLLTLSVVGRDAEGPVERDPVEIAATGVWREVYLGDGTPVPLDDLASVMLDPTELRAFLDSLEVGCDGIEGDDERDPDHSVEAIVRGALVRFLDAKNGV